MTSRVLFVCLQVESETSDSEFRLNNATQRLHVLERDVTLLRDQAQNTSLSVEQTQKDAHSINQVAEKAKKVSWVYILWFGFCVLTARR